MTRQASCRVRWAGEKNSTIADLRKLWRAYQAGEDSKLYQKTSEDLGRFEEYGLSFDYVTRDKGPAYWRYQISWGGPSAEFRFYSNGPTRKPWRISFCFMDWFDGYNRSLVGRDLALLLEIWEDFADCESTKYAYDEAMED